jgi:hypothetical protein
MKQQWDTLKAWLKDQKEYYKEGALCSLAESVWGEAVTGEVLTKMEELEKQNDINTHREVPHA